MKKITDYNKVFLALVKRTEDYICNNNLKCMVLGISGGIDSTVVAAICHEVSKRTGVPLIGRSLPTNYNKEGETSTADLVGKAFCNDYKEVNIQKWYYDSWYFNEHGSDYNAIAAGNIQARLRMIYLYNLASIYKGLVMDTDNLTENNLGYFTIHGDVGDFNPIGGLWKTEVFELAEWLLNHYQQQMDNSEIEDKSYYFYKGLAIKESLKLKPTAGLGITDSDLEEIGAESYEQVDQILKDIIHWKKIKVLEGYSSYKTISYKTYMESTTIDNIPLEVVEAIAKRHFNSEFKRKHLPIVITRNEFFV